MINQAIAPTKIYNFLLWGLKMVLSDRKKKKQKGKREKKGTFALIKSPENHLGFVNWGLLLWLVSPIPPFSARWGAAPLQHPGFLSSCFVRPISCFLRNPPQGASLCCHLQKIPFAAFLPRTDSRHQEETKPKGWVSRHQGWDTIPAPGLGSWDPPECTWSRTPPQCHPRLGMKHWEQPYKGDSEPQGLERVCRKDGEGSLLWIVVLGWRRMALN